MKLTTRAGNSARDFKAIVIWCCLSALCFTACQQGGENTETSEPTPGEAKESTGHPPHHGAGEASPLDTATLLYPGEKHLRNVRQLTFGGDNAEAYFSFDNSMLVFQRTHEASGIPCDQIFFGKIPQRPEEDFQYKMLSTGEGRTTCSYFLPGNDRIVYASTHLSGKACPPPPERSRGRYVWAIYNSYEIFIADTNGRIVQQLTDNDFYDAEATLSPKGDKIVFTSTRSGDLELYTMNLDGTGVQQVTDELGYDGGAFFSPDGERLVFRASRPATPEAQQEYKALLQQGLVAPTQMEVFVCNVDGSGMRQVTDLGNANWAPFWHPSGEKIIFASNHQAERGFPFNLYLIHVDGTGLEQVTFDTMFDAFPMFSFDGKYLAFSSNRNNGGTRETNMFIAEWVE